MVDIGDSIEKLSKIDKFHHFQGKSTAAQKMMEKMQILAISEVLVGFSKKRAKKA